MFPIQKPNLNQDQTPAQFAPPRAGRWVEVLMRYRYAVVIVLVALFVFGQKAMAQEFKSANECVVGKRVVTREKQAGVIVKVSGSSCTVKLDSTGQTDHNIFWMLRAEGASNKVEGGLPQGKYACYFLSGSSLNYAFIDIHIESGNRYRDKQGKPGTYKIEADQKIVFTGPLASANAKLLEGPRIGLNMNGGTFFNTTCSKSKN
jgi:preprotein translocase subunit YajC